MTAEDINPYNDKRTKTDQVREMFDNIAPAYDRLNRTMSFGLDRSWRRKAVNTVTLEKPRHIVDIATGTGDFAISLARHIPDAKITGVDLSENMVEIGRRKVADAGLADRITMMVDDVLDSQLPAGCADVVTVAFGVRNFEHLLDAYVRIHDILRPGGMLCVIELSTPTSRLVKPFYNLYTRQIIPLMGRKISKDNRAYSYLPESIAAVQQGDEMLGVMRSAGFTHTLFRRLTFGVCTIYIAKRPE